jgi:hypothetical protein
MTSKLCFHPGNLLQETQFRHDIADTANLEAVFLVIGALGRGYRFWAKGERSRKLRWWFLYRG